MERDKETKRQRERERERECVFYSRRHSVSRTVKIQKPVHALPLSLSLSPCI